MRITGLSAVLNGWSAVVDSFKWVVGGGRLISAVVVRVSV
jgi:hypothetical protein